MKRTTGKLAAAAANPYGAPHLLPHYCTHPPHQLGGDAGARGCPRWPACVSDALTSTRPAATAPAPEPQTTQLGESIAGLVGMAFGAAVFLVVVALLWPVFTA